MQDSMMIADVGGIEKVSGSRMATPLAPPRPGSTPISTPSRMPTSMNSRFFHVRATAKPCIRLLKSSMIMGPLFLEAEHALDGSLGQRYEEPDLEQHEDHHRNADADRERRQDLVLALEDHEAGDVDRR